MTVRLSMLVAAGLAMLPFAAAAQQGGDDPRRYIDAQNLPGVRTNPRTQAQERCIRKLEPTLSATGERLEEFIVCDHNGVSFRSTAGGIPATPWGPPVGGLSGFGGADTR